MRGFLGVSLLVVCLSLSLSLGGCGGCGDDGKAGQLADAPPLVDAPPDMMVQQDQPVTLTVTNLGEPVAGVHVYFVNANDSLVKTADTDASGNASAVMAAGGSVTAIDPFRAPVGVAPIPRGKSGPELRTFLGVKPGDHLFLTRPLHEDVTFQLIADPAEGANTYDLITTCGTASLDPNGGGSGNPGGASLQLQDCHGGADLAIIASFHTTESNDLVSGLYHADAALLTDHTVNVTADDYTALTNVTLTFANAPDATLTVAHGPIGKHGVLGPFSVDASGGTGTVAEPTVPGVTKAVVDLQLNPSGQHEVVDWGDYTTTYMLDLHNLLLAEVASGPGLDLATDKVSWTEEDSGDAADLTVIGLFVSRSEPQSKSWHWRLAAAHPATLAIKLPVLPTDVFDWTPTQGDSISVDALRNFKVPGGYDAVRGHIFDIDEQGSFRDVVTGASGRALKVISQAAL